LIQNTFNVIQMGLNFHKIHFFSSIDELIVTSNAQQCKGQVEIDITNDEPLQTIWEHMREIRRGDGG
jgi:hypothetical protein